MSLPIWMDVASTDDLGPPESIAARARRGHYKRRAIMELRDNGGTLLWGNLNETDANGIVASPL